jgi:hypothetical protein
LNTAAPLASKQKEAPVKTILLAALLAAAPAFAQNYPGDDDSYQGYDDQQGYDTPPDYAPSDQGPNFDDFRNDSALSWNGEWIVTPEYGYVWRPTRVSGSWQPYLYGRWAWTAAGWAWVSEEPFGWAVYHYGRWAWTADGWVWLPGQVWAPAWVAWNWGNGYAGWCPLGPRAVVYQQPARWVYVPNQHFLEPVRRHVISRPQPIAQGMPGPARGPYAGPPIQAVERAVGHQIRPLAVTEAPAAHAAQASSGSVGFYRPHTVPIATPRAQPQQGPQAAPPGGSAQAPRPGGLPHPIYFGGVPAPRQGGLPRPAPQAQPGSQGTPQAQPAPHAQQPTPRAQPTEPHAKER